MVLLTVGYFTQYEAPQLPVIGLLFEIPADVSGWLNKDFFDLFVVLGSLKCA